MASKSSSPDGSSAPKPRGAASQPLRGLNILLVEDHADTLRILARLLGADGHHVVAVNCMKAALRACGEHKFDLLIADLGLPDGSGNELMEKLHKKCGVKGIALTGWGMESDVAGSRHAGFAVHATKPVDRVRLRALIAQVMLG